MKRINEEKIDDAKFYERIWSEEHNARPYYDAVRMRALIAPVKNGDKVLDVGAGVFGAVQYLAEETKIMAELHAVDQSYTARDIVLKRAPQINYKLSDVVELPYEDGIFDVVMAGEIIEHMEDPAAFCEELLRVTKPGGCVTLSTVDTHCENAKLHGEYPEHIWEFEPKDLLDFFGSGATYTTVGDYHFIDCVKK